MLDIIRSCGLALALLVWVTTTTPIATKHHLPDAAVVAGIGHRRKRASTKKTGPRLSPDPLNANRGTERGQRALDRSLREYGPGRSVLIDKHGTIVAGNKTYERATQLNIPVRIVKSDGTTLIAVQRDDLDEVAAVAVLLASPVTANVTGSNYVIDGGLIKTT